MKHLITAVFSAAALCALGACSKEPANETAASEPAPQANEAAANASGTTTYYGSPEEQQANN